MKKKEIKKLLHNKAVKIGSAVLCAALVFGSVEMVNRNKWKAPEEVTYVDLGEDVEIEDEEVPLAAPKVSTKTSTKTKTKKIKLKKKSTKTYTKSGSTKKQSTKKVNTSKESKTIKTVVNTNVKNQYKKGSNVNTQVTTVKTTVTTTTVTKDTGVKKTTQSTFKGEISLSQCAPKLDAKVKNAYETLGFKVVVDPSVSYYGRFVSRDGQITLKNADDTVYHELGHFVGYLANNYDLSGEFQQVYQAEKNLYTNYDKAYVTQNSSEYFAESFRNYTLDPAGLKSSRPRTYEQIQKALASITDMQIQKLKFFLQNS